MEKNTKNKILFKPLHLFIIIVVFGIILLMIKTDFLFDNFYLFVMIISALGCLYFIKSIIKYTRTGNWETTQATITDSKLKIQEAGADSDAYFEPVIYYKYKVGFNEYSSGNIYPYGMFSGTGNEAAAKTTVSKYKEGQIVPVYYNPSKPEESFLVREGFIPRLIFFLLFLFIFIIMMMAMLKIIDL